MTEGPVLVTGASGLMGGWMLRRLPEVLPGVQLRGVDVRAVPDSGIVACDLTEHDAVVDLVRRERPQAVFHFAGVVAAPSIVEMRERLVAPTATLLDALFTDAPDAVFVLPGSAAEYGSLAAGQARFTEDDAPRPISDYGTVKAEQSALALEFASRGLDARVGRVFNLIGPGIGTGFLVGRIAGLLGEIRAGRHEPRIELGGLSAVRDYVDVRDAIDAMVAVSRRGKRGRIYNICSGVGRTVREVVEHMVLCAGIEVEIVESASGSPRPGLDASVGAFDRIATECGWNPSVTFARSACDAVESAWND